MAHVKRRVEPTTVCPAPDVEAPPEGPTFLLALFKGLFEAEAIPEGVIMADHDMAPPEANALPEALPETAADDAEAETDPDADAEASLDSGAGVAPVSKGASAVLLADSINMEDEEEATSTSFSLAPVGSALGSAEAETSSSASWVL